MKGVCPFFLDGTQPPDGALLMGSVHHRVTMLKQPFQVSLFGYVVQILPQPAVRTARASTCDIELDRVRIRQSCNQERD
jgi:hypothetical protein